MRENPDTSLRIMQFLADEDVFPSRATEQDIARTLGVAQQEVDYHLYLCADGGFIRADIELEGYLSGERSIVVGHIYGLTARGQEYVRAAESRDGKLLESAKAMLAKAKSTLTTQAIAETMKMIAEKSFGG
ncbi:MAG: hypothetical protein OXE73_17100 [Gammaproteobacteria bacterium]|nr:hypothetical protein [Gammaproteobacteria bacterium]